MLATTRKDIDAKVVGGALIVSFLGAEQPKVWRANLGGFSSATFELLHKGDEFSVVVKRDEGKEEKIVTFGDMESAVYALSVITDAMQRGEGKRSGSFFGTLAKICVIVVAAVIVGKLFFGGPPPGVAPIRGLTPGTETGSGALVKPGAPVPAEELFGSR